MLKNIFISHFACTNFFERIKDGRCQLLAHFTVVFGFSIIPCVVTTVVLVVYWSFYQSSTDTVTHSLWKKMSHVFKIFHWHMIIFSVAAFSFLVGLPMMFIGILRIQDGNLPALTLCSIGSMFFLTGLVSSLVAKRLQKLQTLKEELRLARSANNSSHIPQVQYLTPTRACAFTEPPPSFIATLSRSNSVNSSTRATTMNHHHQNNTHPQIHIKTVCDGPYRYFHPQQPPPAYDELTQQI